MKTAVVTGATGAIGRALIKTCIEAGYEVLAVVHRDSSRTAELETVERCHVLRLDLTEYDAAIEELKLQGFDCEDFELFFHLAWMAPFGKDRDNLSLQLQNVNAALSAARFAARIGCSTFIGIGSQAEYGRVDGIIAPDTPTFPETGYGIAKLCAGQMTRLACEQAGIRHIWCRVLSVYGPHDRSQTLISTAVNDMLENKETEFTPCDQMWDYIYSDDAAHAILAAAQKGISGKTYMIGSGESRPLRDYIKEIAEITGYSREVGFGKRPYNDKQVMFLQADISELKKDTGWQGPEILFSDGIRNIVSSKLFENKLH